MSFFGKPGLRSLTGTGASLMSGDDHRMDEWERPQWETFDPSPSRYPMMISEAGELPGSPPSTPPSVPEQPVKHGLLNGGKMTGRDALGLALGVIGDSIAQQNGGQATTLPLFMSAINARREAAAAQAKRQTDFEDWQRRYDYIVAHSQPQVGSVPNGQVPPGPVGPGTAPPQASLPQGFDHREWDIVPSPPQPSAYAAPGAGAMPAPGPQSAPMPAFGVADQRRRTNNGMRGY